MQYPKWHIFFQLPIIKYKNLMNVMIVLLFISKKCNGFGCPHLRTNGQECYVKYIEEMPQFWSTIEKYVVKLYEALHK